MVILAFPIHCCNDLQHAEILHALLLVFISIRSKFFFSLQLSSVEFQLIS